MNLIPVQLLTQTTLNDVGGLWRERDIREQWQILQNPRTEGGKVLWDYIQEHIPDVPVLTVPPLIPPAPNVCLWILLDAVDIFYRLECGPERHRYVFKWLLLYIMYPTATNLHMVCFPGTTLLSQRATECYGNLQGCARWAHEEHPDACGSNARKSALLYGAAEGYINSLVDVSTRHQMYSTLASHGCLPSPANMIAYLYPDYYAEIVK